MELPNELILNIIFFNFIKEYQSILICNKKTMHNLRYNFIIQKLLKLNNLELIYNRNSFSFKNKIYCFSVQKYSISKTIFDIVFKYQKDLNTLIN